MLHSTSGGCRRRRLSPIVGAILGIGARSSAAASSAFQLLCEQRQLPSWREPPFPSTRRRFYSTPHSFGASSKRRVGRGISSSSLPLREGATSAGTFTGWINPDTLDWRAQLRNFNESGDPNDDGDDRTKHPPASPVERILIRDRLAYIKRDDVLRLPSSNVSGNKARKFLALNDIPVKVFPEVLVSYGGPQSNAMVALAAIVSSKNAEFEGRSNPAVVVEDGQQTVDALWQLDVSEEDNSGNRMAEDNNGNKVQAKKQKSNSKLPSPPNDRKIRFVYYTKTMPRYLRKNPNGNLLRALALGMEIRTVSHEEYKRLFGGLNGGSALAPADLDPPTPGRSLWMPQGGACSAARPGSDALAEEILEYWEEEGRGARLAVCVPGGTCTTALLLHRSIVGLLERRREEGKGPMDVRVIVIPCVGDDEYATRQMASLDRSLGGRGRPEDLPSILKPRPDAAYGTARRRTRGYFTFGEPADAILRTYDEMNGYGLFLDLLYGAPAWSLMLQHWKSREDDCPIAGRRMMYIHSGGLEGIASQMTRYKHKGLLDARTIQVS